MTNSAATNILNQLDAKMAEMVGICEELGRTQAERDQLLADHDRLRRALEWQREALDCGYYQYPDGHWSCQDCSRGAEKQEEIKHTDECAFGQIEVALSTPPPDAVKRYEARVKAEVLDALVLRLDRPVVGNGDYYKGKEHERLSVIETIKEQRESAREEANNG